MDHRAEARRGDALMALGFLAYLSVSALGAFACDVKRVQTNILFIECVGVEPSHVVTELKERGVLVLKTADTTLRAVVNLHTTDEDVQKTIAAFAEVSDEALDVAPAKKRKVSNGSAATY